MKRLILLFCLLFCLVSCDTYFWEDEIKPGQIWVYDPFPDILFKNFNYQFPREIKIIAVKNGWVQYKYTIKSIYKESEILRSDPIRYFRIDTHLKKD